MGVDEFEAMYDAAREAYELEVTNRSLAEIKENAIREYFYLFGDDIESRIRCRIKAAKALATTEFSGESLVSSITAVEITIRWFLLRPLCEASFISESLADIFVDELFPRRRAASGDRNLFPKILREWGSGVDVLKLSNGDDLWDKVTNEFIRDRNDFVHRGKFVSAAVAIGAADAAEQLLAEAIRVVQPFTKCSKDGWAPKDRRQSLENM
jgi:hypothetical protein